MICHGLYKEKTIVEEEKEMLRDLLLFLLECYDLFHHWLLRNQVELFLLAMAPLVIKVIGLYKKKKSPHKNEPSNKYFDS